MSYHSSKKIHQIPNRLQSLTFYSDIIATEPSDGDVNKMILGSFVESYDEEDCEESLTSQYHAHRFSDPAPQTINEVPHLNRAFTHPPIETPDQSTLTSQANPGSIRHGQSARIT